MDEARPPQEAPSIRLLIIDDHAIMRAGLKMLIESTRGMELVGEAPGGEEGVKLARERQPDVILLDLHLRGESGIELLSRLQEVSPAARVLVLTGVTESDTLQDALTLGASGIIFKEQKAEVLLGAIRSTARGEAWLEPSVIKVALHRLRKPHQEDVNLVKTGTLTRRERDIVSLVAHGLSNQEIASHLHLSDATVRHHLTSIYAKLDVKSRLQLSVYAHRHGLTGKLEP